MCMCEDGREVAVKSDEAQGVSHETLEKKTVRNACNLVVGPCFERITRANDKKLDRSKRVDVTEVSSSS